MSKTWVISLVVILLLTNCSDSGEDDPEGAGGTDGTNGVSGSNSATGGQGDGDSGPAIATRECDLLLITTEQDLVDAADCGSVSGDLRVDQTATEITDLDELSNLKTVEGNVHLAGPKLTSIQGLSGLTSIGKALTIMSPSLTSLEGLNNLQTVGSHLYLMNSSAVTDVDGLSGLTTVGGDLKMMSTTSLNSLDGLKNLTTVEGNMTIEIAPKLPTCNANELHDQLGKPAENKTQDICGTLVDECGGAECSPFT